MGDQELLCCDFLLSSFVIYQQCLLYEFSTLIIQQYFLFNSVFCFHCGEGESRALIYNYVLCNVCERRGRVFILLYLQTPSIKSSNPFFIVLKMFLYAKPICQEKNIFVWDKIKIIIDKMFSVPDKQDKKFIIAEGFVFRL